MNGMEKIIQKITAEGDQAAEEILNKARSEREARLSKAQEDCRQKVEEATKLSAKESASFITRHETVRESDRKQRILAHKMEIIEQLEKDLLQELLSLPEKEYFSLLLSIVGMTAEKKSGTLYLNAKDLKRKPADFDQKAALAAKKRGGELVVSNVPGEISSGVLLVYDGTEERGTIENLIAENHAALCDVINNMMWRN